MPKCYLELALPISSHYARRKLNMALQILSQPVSASKCETNWSQWGYVCNERRNKLDKDRVIKLMYVNANIRAVSCVEALE